METVDHGTWGHGLRPGTTRAISCDSCQLESLDARLADVTERLEELARRGLIHRGLIRARVLIEADIAAAIR